MIYPKEIQDVNALETLEKLKSETIPLKYRKVIDIAIFCISKEMDNIPILCGNTYSHWHSCPTCDTPLKRRITRVRNHEIINFKKEDLRFYERCSFCGSNIFWDPDKIEK